MNLRVMTAILLLAETCVSANGQQTQQAAGPAAHPEGEAFFFIPPGFTQEGRPKTADGAGTGLLQIDVVDESNRRPAACRINVIGSDGNYYQPPENPLTLYSLAGQWPATGFKGNRKDKSPHRYLGRYFYSTGSIAVRVPAGATRVEVFKGFEFAPQSTTVNVVSDQEARVTARLKRTLPMSADRYFGGDPHLHFARTSERDDHTIFELLDAEDIAFGTPLGYNEPAGPYSGFMDKMDSPQFQGLGVASIRSRGPVQILSGQEYRSGQYGHLNLYLRDRLVFEGESHNADEWPVYGHIGSETRSQGGVSIHAHGGYGLEIYADAALGTIDAVELLQFGIYRGIGLADWYHMLNTGYRFPCVGASDYPACRFLGDCRTYVWQDAAVDRPDFPDWLRAAGSGRSFVTTGPMLLMDVDGKRPGEAINVTEAETTTVTIRARVRCDVTPVQHLDIIVNGQVVRTSAIPQASQSGEWYSVDLPLELKQSSWIAARAWSTTKGGMPDAESHTNPVFVDLNGVRPYSQTSLDAWVVRIDEQIARHTSRSFPQKARVLDYFQRSRDMLLRIRESGGLKSDEDPAKLAEQLVQSGGTGLMQDLAQPAVTDDALREFLKPVPSKPPQEALATFEGVDGFEMQLVAVEPLVTSPVATAFDEDGNLYVCEMRDYPYKPADGREPIGRVTFLRDTDGDGDFDESHIFADKLLWAAGVVPWKGGVFVAATPDIWYFKDIDGDFKADIRKRVFTGFGTGNQQAMVNNLRLSFDHWIYGSTAGNGGIIRPGDDTGAKPIAVTGRDFRFHPETLQFELVTGTVQFGNTFDDFGNRFVCSESQPLHHIVLPDHYLARNPFLPSPHGIQNIAPGPVPIFRISPIERWRQIRSSRRITKSERAATSPGASHHVVDAAAGVIVYRGGAYPPEFYGQVFVGDGQNNLIHRRQLIPDGVTFRSERVDTQTDFLRSSDIWFRPVNLINAPDGTLHCCDMNREVLESIHIPLDVVRHLDLKSGRDNGRIYRIAPPGFQIPNPPRLSTATTDELVATLESPHGWWRDTAQRLLFERRDPAAVPLLISLAASSERPETRVLALWSLQGLGALEESQLAESLRDQHAGVREQAVRLAERRADNDAILLAELCTRATDSSDRVRFQTAFSLGEVALVNHNTSAIVSTLADLARRDGENLWMRTAVLSSSANIADRLLIELLSQPTTPAVAAIVDQLVQVTGSRGKPEEIRRTLDTIASSPGIASSAERTRLLVRLSTGVKRSGGRLNEKLPAGDSAGSLLFAESLRLAEQQAADPELDANVRLAAIELLSSAPNEVHSSLLLTLLEPVQPEPLQLAALHALGDDASPETPAAILQRWKTLAPTLRHAAMSVMLSRTDATLALVNAAAAGEVAVSEFDPAQRELLLNHRDATIRAKATIVLGDAQDTSRRSVVTHYQNAMIGLKGDAGRGVAMYEQHCAVCHQIGGKGFAVGPNLASSPSRDPAVLLNHILDPNQYVLPNYVQYVVVDQNGRSKAGMLASQSATSVTLKKERGESVTLLRGDIDEMISTGRSLMPEGLEKVIPPQSMSDLLTWLSQQVQQVTTDANSERDFGTLPGPIESP